MHDVPASQRHCVSQGIAQAGTSCERRAVRCPSAFSFSNSPTPRHRRHTTVSTCGCRVAGAWSQRRPAVSRRASIYAPRCHDASHLFRRFFRRRVTDTADRVTPTEGFELRAYLGKNGTASTPKRVSTPDEGGHVHAGVASCPHAACTRRNGARLACLLGGTARHRRGRRHWSRLLRRHQLTWHGAHVLGQRCRIEPWAAASAALARLGADRLALERLRTPSSPAF